MARILKVILLLLPLVLLAGIPAVASAETESSGGALRITAQQSAPSVSLAGTANAQVRLNAPVSVTVTFSEPVSGFTVDDISVVNGTGGNLAGSGAVYTFEVTPDAIGEVTVDIAAGVAAGAGGDGNTAAPQFSLGIPYDDDRDGAISRPEVITAIRDYLTGGEGISRAEVIRLIRLYLSPPSTLPNPPGAPQGLTATANGTTAMDLSWSAPPSNGGAAITGYRIEVSEDGSTWTDLVVNTGTAATSHSHLGLTAGSTRHYRVSAINSAGTGPASNIATGTTDIGPCVEGMGPLTVAVTRVGEWASGCDSTNRSGSYARFYAFTLEERATARISLQANHDTVLYLLEGSGTGGTVLVEEDSVAGQGGATVARIIHTLDAGTYTIEATTYFPARVGAFHLSIGYFGPVQPTEPGLVLEIEAPEQLDPFIANILAEIVPRVTYSGTQALSFVLEDAPGGMSIEEGHGIIIWTPQASDEGRTFEITVKVADGALSAEVSFEVMVVGPEAVATEIAGSPSEGNTLTVVDAGTTLNGLEITSPPEETPITTAALRELQQVLAKAPPESVPEMPSRITPISDVFVVKGIFDHPAELRFPVPTSQLPDDIQLEDINLYIYAASLHTDGQSWFPVAIDWTFEGTETEPVFVMTLARLEGLAVFGYHRTSAVTPAGLERSDSGQGAARFESKSPGVQPTAALCAGCEPPDIEDISCEEEDRWFGLGGKNPNKLVCTYGPAPDVQVKIDVRDRIPGASECLWIGDEYNTCPAIGRRPVDVAQWAITAQLHFENLGLKYDKTITVRIEDLGGPRGKVELMEGYNVVHIKHFQTVDDATWTLYHEYFHHVQGHRGNSEIHEELFVNLRPKFLYPGWLIESLAEWFTDEPGDDLNAFELGPSQPLPLIFEKGLSHPEDKFDGYNRWLFFKLLQKECTDFESYVRELLVKPLVNLDFSGLGKLRTVIESSSCGFGNHLGADRAASLEAAIAYYNYATLLKKDIKLVDSNEEARRFVSAPAYTDTDTMLRIPGVGAYSFKVSGLQLSPGEAAQLAVESDEEIIVSITSEDTSFEGMNTIGPDNDHHLWFATGKWNTRINSHLLGGGRAAGYLRYPGQHE